MYGDQWGGEWASLDEAIADLTRGLIHHWALDTNYLDTIGDWDLSGNAVASAGTSKDGAGAYDSNSGAGSSLQKTFSPNEDLSGPFTFAAWIRNVDGQTFGGEIFRSSALFDYRCQVNANTHMRIALNSGAQAVVEQAPYADYTDWVCVQIDWDGVDTARLKVNGKDRVSVTGSGVDLSSVSYLQLFQTAGNHEHIGMDQAHFWDRLLSDEEAEAFYNVTDGGNFGPTFGVETELIETDLEVETSSLLPGPMVSSLVSEDVEIDLGTVSPPSPMSVEILPTEVDVELGTVSPPSPISYPITAQDLEIETEINAGPFITSITSEVLEVETGLMVTDLTEPAIGTFVLEVELSSLLPGPMTTRLSDTTLELETDTITTVIQPAKIPTMELAVITSRFFGKRYSGVTLSNFVQLNAVED